MVFCSLIASSAMRAFISALKVRRCLDFISAPFPRRRFYTLMSGPNFGEHFMSLRVILIHGVGPFDAAETKSKLLPVLTILRPRHFTVPLANRSRHCLSSGTPVQRDAKIYVKDFQDAVQNRTLRRNPQLL